MFGELLYLLSPHEAIQQAPYFIFVSMEIICQIMSSDTVSPTPETSCFSEAGY